MARAMLCQVCFREVAVVGVRCADCAPVQARAAVSKGKRPLELSDAAVELAVE